jgi:phosphate transport system protein
MLRDAIDAFVRGDAEAARALVLRDDEVDELNRRVFAELLRRMSADPSQIERSMTLVLVARNLERIGDLATNIAEEVVFIAEARIIKHHADEGVA